MIEAIHHGFIPYLAFKLTLLFLRGCAWRPSQHKKQAENAQPLQYDAAPIVMTIVVRFWYAESTHQGGSAES
ncbi:MAG: hypothetical protein COB20_03240 [SAR86 cluster bacterium]|uniref:Uncharacterized protein n=1 Tax=SAR86 cluster bacterium TaxID=2030880 RepID=A0A2A4XCR3_9GAMM|nr:MAG: hypothetical protein COB20_03240 [SAR86 cluster bacterium]